VPGHSQLRQHLIASCGAIHDAGTDVLPMQPFSPLALSFSSLPPFPFPFSFLSSFYKIICPALGFFREFYTDPRSRTPTHQAPVEEARAHEPKQTARVGLGLKGTLRLDVLKGGEPFEKLRRRVEEADFLQILGRNEKYYKRC